MKQTRVESPARSFRLAIFMTIPVLLFASGMYGQSGGGIQRSAAHAQGGNVGLCEVTRLRLTIATADDDLRGGKDNLDIIIYFTNGGYQLAPNVNRSQDWPNNSTNTVGITLKRPIPPNQISGLRLVHIADGGFNLSISPELATLAAPFAIAEGFQSPDNWHMGDIEIAAIGNGFGAPIGHHGYHSFTGTDPALSIRTQVPANICGSGGSRYGRLNPSDRTLQKISGAGSKYGKEPAHSAVQTASSVTRQQLQNNRLIQKALAHTVQVGPRASELGVDASRSAIIEVLKRQSATAHSLLLPAFTGGVKPGSGQTNGAKGAMLAAAPTQSGPMLSGSGGANQTGTLLNPGTTRSLNPQPYPPKGSQPQIGASQTMSASGTQSAGPSTNPTATQVNPPSGPTAQRPPAGRQPLPPGTRAPAPITTICRTGIATVDGGANGIWFSPVAGQDGGFVIQGCGFGNAPGEVYLSGVQFDPAHARLIVQHVGVSNSPDHVYFQIPANGWGDRQIIAQIDPNAGGLYDTNNVTLNVKTASGQVYQATGMNFLAARADQLLNWIVPAQAGYSGFASQTSSVSSPTATINLTTVMDSSGNQIVPTVESPSASTIFSNETVDVIRAKLGESTPSKVIFGGGTDTYQLNLAPGFQLDPQHGVVMRHTQIDVAQCQTAYQGEYNTSGNWAISYSSEKSFQVSWQEQACWPQAGTQGVSPLDYGSVSVYALEIRILGPRGATPWASGKVNGLAVKQLQPVQILHKN